MKFWIPSGSAKRLISVVEEYKLDIPTGTPGMFEHQLSEFEYYAIAVGLREYVHNEAVSSLLNELKYYYKQNKANYRLGSSYVV